MAINKLIGVNIVKISKYCTFHFFFTGYLDEVRISNGMARWTNNFTVPTAAY